MQRHLVVEVLQQGVGQAEGIADEHARGRLPLRAAAQGGQRRRIGLAVAVPALGGQRLELPGLLGRGRDRQELLDVVHVPLGEGGQGGGGEEQAQRERGREATGHGDPPQTAGFRLEGKV